MTVPPLDPLSVLLSTPHAPAFIHLHHPHHPSTSLPRPRLLSSSSPSSSHAVHSRYAQVDLIELNNPKLLYSTILHRLAADGAAHAASSSSQTQVNGEIGTWDEFALGMRELLGGESEKKRGKKAERWHPENGENGGQAGAIGSMGKGRAVVMITYAERLRAVLGNRWTVITRMGELIGCPVTVVTASQQTWDHLRPYAADAPEPIHVYLPAASRAELLSTLTPTSAATSTSSDGKGDTDNPFLTSPESQSSTVHPLWPHFCQLLLASFAHVAPTPAELSFLAEPLWTLYTAKLPPHAEQHLLRPASRKANGPTDGLDAMGAIQPLDITVKLLTDLKYAISPAFANATESLLSGTVGRSTFLSSLMPSASLDVRHLDTIDNPLAGPSKRSLPRAPSLSVPYIAKFLLIASYLASQNPPRTDLRLFGRGLTADGKKKKGGGTRRAGYGRVKVGKVPQRLVGPKPFPLERGLAIWAALYAENGKRPADLDADEGSSGSEGEYGENDDQGEMPDDDEEGPSTPSKRKNGVSATLPPLPGSTAKATKIRAEDLLYSRAERESKRAERKRKREVEKEERWEEYVDDMSMSVSLWSMIPDLEAQGLVKRVSPSERLDGVQIRCEIGYEAAVGLAKEVGIVLDEYLYEAQA